MKEGSLMKYVFIAISITVIIVTLYTIVQKNNMEETEIERGLCESHDYLDCFYDDYYFL